MGTRPKPRRECVQRRVRHDTNSGRSGDRPPLVAGATEIALVASPQVQGERCAADQETPATEVPSVFAVQAIAQADGLRRASQAYEVEDDRRHAAADSDEAAEHADAETGGGVDVPHASCNRTAVAFTPKM